MTSCPDCCCPGAVIESRRCGNGTRRRRYECQGCSRRWTRYDGDPPGHGGGVPKGSPGRRRIPDAAIRRILTATGSVRSIAAATGCSRPTVAAIRRGEVHADLFPELPRQGNCLTCLQCQHWDGRCGMGFPDPEIEGLGFAGDCSLYVEAGAQ